MCMCVSQLDVRVTDCLPLAASDMNVYLFHRKINKRAWRVLRECSVAGAAAAAIASAPTAAGSHVSEAFSLIAVTQGMFVLFENFNEHAIIYFSWDKSLKSVQTAKKQKWNEVKRISFVRTFSSTAENFVARFAHWQRVPVEFG